MILRKSLGEKKPSLIALWHPTKNGDKTIFDINYGSRKKVWWKCPVADDHEWEATPNDKHKSSGCPFCKGHKVALSTSLYKKRPDIAKQWHPTKNNNLSPKNFSEKSSQKVWWKCPVADDHEWEAVILSRTNQGGNCPFCLGQRVALSNCLATTNPKLAKEWHPTKNKNLTPFDIVAGYNKKVWWKCPVADDHEWEAKPNDRKRQGCSICAGKKIVKSNSLPLLNPEVSKEWHPYKNNKNPKDYALNSSKNVWWKCKICTFEWEAVIANRTYNMSGCPNCSGSGFNPKLKGYLYLHKISINNKEAIKVGITNNRYKRIKTYQREKRNYQMKNITHFYGDGKIVKECEKFIKKKYSTSYLSKKEMPEGYTETIKYDKNNLKDIIQYCIERI